jgi:flagellar assembly factor FliW
MMALNTVATMLGFEKTVSFFYSDSKYGLHPYMALFITYPIIFNLKKSLSEQYPVTCNKYSTC